MRIKVLDIKHTLLFQSSLITWLIWKCDGYISCTSSTVSLAVPLSFRESDVCCQQEPAVNLTLSRFICISLCCTVQCVIRIREFRCLIKWTAFFSQKPNIYSFSKLLGAVQMFASFVLRLQTQKCLAIVSVLLFTRKSSVQLWKTQYLYNSQDKRL